MNAFRFKFKPQPQIPMQWRQTDASTPKDTVEIASKSRAKEKKDLVDRLLARASSVDLTVLPIVGMGGLGKTTIAQLVYNDPEIQKHFDLRLWVCVSDDFDVSTLADRIVKENGYEAKEGSALEKLQNVVSGKRYLLVLDDVWNRDEHKWEKLKSYLQHGSSGSSVLTTTRDQAVAKLMMDASEGVYVLESLGTDFIEEIFKKRAFSSEKKEEWPRELVGMIGEVTKRCFGSPLAATALGSVLGTKTSKKEWEDVINGSTICDEENEILSVLKLSYNCFPSYMRQCFAFCAMFPKDYEIDVQMLIHLWIANGFISEQPKVCLETIGEKIFNELKSRSFFQDLKHVPFDEKPSSYGVDKKYRYCPIITCKIHDLMHDVAQSAMGEECAAIATHPSEGDDVLRSVRHLYLSIRQPETLLNASLQKGSPTFQTLICDEYVKEDMKILSNYNSIRALRISRGSLLMRPKFLHHLRYFDLSGIYIQALPEDISILYHLQTLNLSHCQVLKRLPKGLKYLTSLRHLYTHGCRELKSMPAELGRLTSLQTLTYFVASEDSGCSSVSELQNLGLGGKLELSQLENVTGADAQAAGLGNKEKLAELELCWTDSDQEAENNNHKEVLEGLKPHDGLKALSINGCGSSTFPAWMSTLRGMVELRLCGCKNVEKLPALWELQALQVLCLKGLGSSHCLCSGGRTPVTFPELKVLFLSNIPKFEAWIGTDEKQGEGPIFPKVEKLGIYDCGSLTALPKGSLLANQSFGGAETVCRRSAFPALRRLCFCRLSALERWGVGEEVTFPLLERLEIYGCPRLTDLPEAPKLSELTIENDGPGPQQISLEAASRCIPSLSRLSLDVSPDDTEITLLRVKKNWNGTLGLAAMELRQCDIFFSSHSSALALWTCFAQLVDLTIGYCGGALVYWPENVFQFLVRLRNLTIFVCSNLTGRTQASDEQSAPVPAPTPERGGLPPRLEYLRIEECESFVEVPSLPASLKTLRIDRCSKLESIVFGQEEDTRLVSAEGVVGPDTSSSLIPGCSSSSEAAASTAVRRPQGPCLDTLSIEGCAGLSEVANLPPSIKTLNIDDCGNLQSLSGQLDAVQRLTIRQCGRLVSLPDEPQAYLSLRVLWIINCDGIKLLPTSLQSRLDYLERKDLDARFEGPDLPEPTWKRSIRKLVCSK